MLNLDKWSVFGQRDTASGEVLLENVLVTGDLAIEEGSPPDPYAASPTLLGAFDQALHAAIDIGIARAAMEDGAEFVRTRSRPWKEALDAGIERADEELHWQPLATLAIEPETQFCLGLVHAEDGAAGAKHRAALAARFLPEFGLSTECGLGRHSAEQLDQVADAVAELFETRSPALA